MKPEKTVGYWRTRILLVFTVIYTAIVLGTAFASISNAPWSDYREETLVVSLLAVGLAVIGLIWALRIFRGARHEPPPWRYRDR